MKANRICTSSQLPLKQQCFQSEKWEQKKNSLIYESVSRCKVSESSISWKLYMRSFHKYTRSPPWSFSARPRQVNGVSCEFMCGSIFEIMMLKFHHGIFSAPLSGRCLFGSCWFEIWMCLRIVNERPSNSTLPPRYLHHHSSFTIKHYVLSTRNHL